MTAAARKAFDEAVALESSGDLEKARAAQKKVKELARIIYQFGEPSSNAHHRMKTALTLQGHLSSMVARPPLRPLPEEDVDQIRRELARAGVEVPVAA